MDQQLRVVFLRCDTSDIKNMGLSLLSEYGLLALYVYLLPWSLINLQLGDAPSYMATSTLNPSSSSLSTTLQNNTKISSPVRSLTANCTYGNFKDENSPLTMNTDVCVANVPKLSTYNIIGAIMHFANFNNKIRIYYEPKVEFANLLK